MLFYLLGETELTDFRAKRRTSKTFFYAKLCFALSVSSRFAIFSHFLNQQTILGSWGEWSEWGACSLSADYGVRIRHRLCSSPLQSCPGEDYQVEECIEKPVNCIVPSLPGNSSFVNCANESGSASSGSKCEILCDQGFLPTGETRITCTDYGWSAQFGSCVPVPTAQCAPLEEVEHGKVVCSDSFMSSSECLLVCDEGFQASGESSTVCLEHSQSWSETLGTCNEAKCKLKNKEYAAGVSILTEICRKKCTCAANGAWHCEEHDCKDEAEKAQCVLDIESSNYECQVSVGKPRPGHFNDFGLLILARLGPF